MSMINFKLQGPGIQKQSLMFHGIYPLVLQGVCLKKTSLVTQRILIQIYHRITSIVIFLTEAVLIKS